MITKCRFQIGLKVSPLRSSYVFLFLVFFFSCSSVLQKIDSDSTFGERRFKTKRTYCPLSDQRRMTLISDSEKNNHVFKNVSKRVKDPKKILFFWFLFQFDIRPDIISDDSDVQFVIVNKGKFEFLDFRYGHEDQRPAHNAIHYLYKLLSIEESFKNLLAEYKRIIPKDLYISRSFNQTLMDYQTDIEKNELLSQRFIKAGQILKNGEQFQRVFWTNKLLDKEKHKQKKVIPIRGLLPPNFSRESNVAINCNFDLNLYESSIYLIDRKLEIKKHPFGINLGNELILFGIFQKPFIKTENIFDRKNISIPPARFCQIKTSEESQINIMSFGSRDPGQQIFNLIEYGIQDSEEIAEIDELLRFARHMFLRAPNRMLYESHRGKEQQLDRILQMNFPIYHIENLGNVWTFNNFKTHYQGFVIEPRQEAFLECD